MTEPQVDLDTAEMSSARSGPVLIATEPTAISAEEEQIANAINRRIFETSDLIPAVDRHGTLIRVSLSAPTILVIILTKWLVTARSSSLGGP
jgi:hypothetical protein